MCLKRIILIVYRRHNVVFTNPGPTKKNTGVAELELSNTRLIMIMLILMI